MAINIMQKHKKTLGIIGGMGPLATAHFYQVLIRQTEAEHDQDHPRVFIDSNPQIPDRTLALIGKGPSPVPAIIETAQNLVKMGAHLLAMPCITAHAFFPEIQESVKIPVIHMLEADSCSFSFRCIYLRGIIHPRRFATLVSCVFQPYNLV